SPGQRAIWFLERLAPESGAYNVVVAARVRDGIDAAALERALRALTARHEALRTVIRETEGEPARRVLPEGEVDFQRVDAGADLAAEAWRPFDLERGPQMRVRLGDGVVLLAVHHLAVDFASLAV